MVLKVALVFLPLLALCSQVIGEKAEPMVAFLCNRPSMYLTDDGWIKDDNTGCLRDPVDILNYCRKVYPKRDVTNVVEASHEVTIQKWCGFGHTRCHQEFTVRPFRCLVGRFQSDALLVPEHCVFDHVHNSQLCTSYNEWNSTAAHSCLSRNMELRFFSMLQPCGIDRFNGVEFVCCPTNKAEKATQKPVVVTEPPEKPKPAKPVKESKDPLTAYMHRSSGAVSQNGYKWKEHDYFLRAVDDMRQLHQDKVAKVMKEWAAARQHVLNMKKHDPKGAERLNKEITNRFQKTYEALEVEGALEKKQLSALHQQRVQSELNEKKRHALDNYMGAIEDNNDPSEIMRTLKHYIKVMQKDRLHTMNRYKHLRDTDPAEAEAGRQGMADHLRTIDQQLTLALGMLDRVPRYKRKVHLQIDEYLDGYHALDTMVAALMKSLIDNPPTTTRRPVVDDKDDSDDEYYSDSSESDSKQSKSDSYSDSDDDDDDDNDYYDDEDQEDERLSSEKDDDTTGDDDKEIDDQVPHIMLRGEPVPVHAVHDVKEAHQPHVAHAEKSYLDVKEPYIKKSPIKSTNGFNASIPLGLVVGGVTIFIVIIAGVVVMRRRHQRRMSNAVRVRLDPAATPEERHIAAMQMTGYENPTYKYFESSGTASA